MLSREQLEQILQKQKPSSLCDIVQIIITQVNKRIDMQPYRNLENRIEMIQNMEGLDSVQIQEVKALVEAMIECKQDQIRRDLERTIHQAAMEQSQSRRSLREIDLNDLLSVNSQAHQKYSQTPLKIHQLQSQVSNLQNQIQNLKHQLQRKCQSRELSSLKMSVQKQLTQKITLDETEKIVQKFQNTIFTKLSETSLNVQRSELEMRKNLMQELHQLKKQLSSELKSQNLQNIHELSQKISKVDKKSKKMHKQLGSTLQELRSECIEQLQSQKQSLGQICNVIQNLDQSHKINICKIQEIEGTLLSMENLTEKQNLPFVSVLCDNGRLKNGCAVWGQCMGKNNKLFGFEQNKTQLFIHESGYYKIQGIVHCLNSHNPPMAIVSDQGYGFERGISDSWKICDIFNIQEAETVKVKINGAAQDVRVLIRIQKIG